MEESLFFTGGVVVSIWSDHYGVDKSPDFVAGVKAGIKMYAHWKGGHQEVGTTGRTLVQALVEVDQWIGEIVDSMAKEALKEVKESYSDLLTEVKEIIPQKDPVVEKVDEIHQQMLKDARDGKRDPRSKGDED